MKKLSNQELKKLQKIELEMLYEFDRICKRHNLVYILAGGSCLGAVRHDGFIPWDDDIDIHMPRSDYEKFLTIQEEELNKDKYYFESLETTENYPFVFAKIRRRNSIYAESISDIDKEKQGIWIDIFPCDNVSDNDFKMKLDFMKIFFFKIMQANKNGNQSVSDSFLRSIILKIIYLISFLVPRKFCQKHLIKIMRKYENIETKRVICYGGKWLFKEMFPAKYFNERILHKFEDGKFYITKDYDTFLTNLYGDYMKLPPKEKRCPEHLISEIKFPEDNL